MKKTKQYIARLEYGSGKLQDRVFKESNCSYSTKAEALKVAKRYKKRFNKGTPKAVQVTGRTKFSI
jgi:hypothetical protein